MAQLEEEPGKSGGDNPYSSSIVPESDMDLQVPEMKMTKILRCFRDNTVQEERKPTPCVSISIAHANLQRL